MASIGIQSEKQKFEIYQNSDIIDICAVTERAQENEAEKDTLSPG